MVQLRCWKSWLQGAYVDIANLDRLSRKFGGYLQRVKQDLAPSEFGWYPYGTLDNFFILNQLLSGSNRNFLDQLRDGLVVDIGTADGDLAFFLESLGHRVHIADYPPTNFNGCRGVRLLKQKLNSQVLIQETDLDSHFQLPAERYELAFFLGILYHLKNPFYALENLARHSRHAFISTRIARFNVAVGAEGQLLNRQRVELASIPVAYLVAEDETNNDETNFWMFSEAGLRRVLYRSGWDVLDFITLGNTRDSDPATSAGDERAFCYVRSRYI